MARFYPGAPPAHSPSSECKVREYLAPVDDLVVLHSVAWQSRRAGRQSDGEADFVLLVPNHGVLVLEVKGGDIEVFDGRWYSTGADHVRHAIKNPFEQAKDSKYALLAFFKDVDPPLTRIPIVHGAVFPDIIVEGMIGFDAPRAIVLDRQDLSNPSKSIERMFLHWEKRYPLSVGEMDRIVSHLAPTVRIRRLLGDIVGEADRALIELTSEQIRVLQSLRRVKKAAILGCAGSGKTVLAVEKARQLVASGFKTLLLCYNAPLRRHLAAVLEASGVEVESFHTLVVREARRSKTKIPFDPPDAWYESEAATTLRRSIAVVDTRFDAVLIDEAQDFAQEWLSSVQGLLADDQALLYLFADSHQDLYRRGWSIPEGLVEYELTVNCRNTRPIAQRVASVFGDSLEGKAIEGPDPMFIEVDRGEQIVPYVVRLIESLILEERITPQQLVVLTDAAWVVTDLRTRMAAGQLFTTLEGRGIPVETVFRFKGLEREVVVLALTDNSRSSDIRALTYVGVSRARVMLYVFGSAKVKESVAW